MAASPSGTFQLKIISPPPHLYKCVTGQYHVNKNYIPKAILDIVVKY